MSEAQSTEDTPEAPSSTASKNLPTRRLPTPRIAFSRQLDILRAYAAKSEEGKRAVSNEEVGELVGMSKDTVTLVNAFFADVALLTRVESSHIPSPEVVNYLRVHQWDPDKAPNELAPKLGETWFAKALLPKLVYSPMSVTDALTELAKASSAGPAYRPQLQTLIEYLKVAGLVSEENGQLTASGAPATNGASPGKAAEPTPTSAPAPPPAPARGGAAGGTQLPLLVQGLLQQLPTGSAWSREGVESWITLARNIFDVVYDLPPKDGDGP